MKLKTLIAIIAVLAICYLMWHAATQPAYGLEPWYPDWSGQCEEGYTETEMGSCYLNPSEINQLQCVQQGALVVPHVLDYWNCIVSNERLNWAACADGIDKLYIDRDYWKARAQACEASTLSLCERLELEKGEWTDGNLWKPISDNTGRPVILFRAGWCGAVEGARLYDETGNQVASASPRHGRGVCEHNGNREHWDASVYASSLPEPSYFIIEHAFRGTLCFALPEPEQRYD